MFNIKNIQTGVIHELTKPVYTFGRHQECDFVFTQKRISSKHCELRLDGSDVIVRDTNSLNGIFIDGSRVVNESTLFPNSVFSLSGEISFQLLNRPINIDIHPAFIEPNGPSQRFSCGPSLGNGAFAEVRYCSHLDTGVAFAAKIIDKKKFAQQHNDLRPTSYLDEISILKKIRHPYIVSIEDVFETSHYLTIILQYVDGGDLFDKIIEVTRFRESDAKIIFKQMIDGIRYLHENNIAHRDLKPENYLVRSKDSNVHVIMTDFGLAKVYDNATGNLKTMCGTPQYLAPELVAQMRSNRATGYTQAVDMWALGVILYILLVGYPPFGPKDFDRIISAKYDFNHKRWSTVSSSAKDMITRLLTLDPKKRLTIQQASEHKWLEGVIVPPI